MIKLTAFFDDPFWVGVFEKIEDGRFEICRVVFGHEPKDYEIYEFVLLNFYKLKFSKPLSVDEKPETKVNPKRIQREIRKATQQNGIGTKAQQALRLDYENKKSEKKLMSKERHEMQETLKFEKRQEKKKQKKRGH